MRQGKARYVFPGSNTPAGFFSFYKEGLKGLERIFILKGGPGTGKSTLMRKIGAAMLERGYDVDFWQCSSDNDSLDGIIIPAISAAVVDGTAPHIVDPAYPGAVDEIVNLGDHWDEAYLIENKQQIINHTNYIAAKFSQCYEKLAEAGALMDELQTLNKQKIDANKLEATIEMLEREIFVDYSPPVRHLFSSAVTPKGLISFADSLSRDYPLRYVITGDVGCGQEQILKKIADTSEHRGHKIEVYHNTFVPEQIELILLPDLGIALVTDTNIKKIKEDDKVIDVSGFLTDRETEAEAEPEEQLEVTVEVEDNNELLELKKQFSQLVESAAESIAEAKARHDKLESYYIKAMDFEAVDNTGNRLFNKMLALAAEKE